MKLDFDTDAGMGAQLRAGLIVLETDETMENELRPLFCAPGVSLNHARIPSAPEVTPETLAQMEADMTPTAAQLPRDMQVIGYGCTSGATIIGEDRVSDLVRKAQPGAVVTNPISAVMAACRHLGAQRIGLLTPYVPAVTSAMQALLDRSGFEVSALASFEQSSEETVARITESATLAGIKTLGAQDCDIIFASCTNLRTFSIIEEAEAATGKPVISSNLALGWHMLTAAGDTPAGTGPGRLFSQA